MAGSYDKSYKEMAFQIWYAGNRMAMKGLHIALPEPDTGTKPSKEVLNQWKVHEAWIDRANLLDEEVRLAVERELIATRVEMMKRHAEVAKEMIEMALEKLRATGFDTSASAVQALKVGFEEEKRSRGAEVSLTRLNEMDDDQLTKAFRQLTGQVTNIDIIDADTAEELKDEE
jgi:hypothetical protein